MMRCVLAGLIFMLPVLCVAQTIQNNQLKRGPGVVGKITWDDTSAPPKAPPPTPETKYLRNVVQAARTCAGKSHSLMNCYIEASPKRCEQSAINFISHPDSGQRTWAMCVLSCADAGIMSRTFGKCRR